MRFNEENFPLSDVTESATPREARGFTPDQMVACEECVRANPPTRMNCLYCGAALPTDDGHAALRRPSLRQMEEWEGGINIILMPGGGDNASREAFNEAADLLRLESARVNEMWLKRRPLPLARVSTSDEAALIKERLDALGLRSEVVPDESLAAFSPPRRVRQMDLGIEALTFRAGAGGDEHVVGWEDVTAFVLGRIFNKRVEVEERGSLPGVEKEIAEARELKFDEAVLDVYTKDFDVSWRINADNFDYSCLGARKTLLAKDNFVTLTDALRSRAGAAFFDDYYLELRHLLFPAWPLGERTESRGLRRERPGKFNTEAITHVSNEAQFTRYSRLCHYFQLQRSGSL
ncbi:MAG TPA: hypothetical protein VM943_10645 [Pyrinomonadaceae bacterium]|nr:hypothetical protein [Pyrinomonadaceae bacterium]